MHTHIFTLKYFVGVMGAQLLSDYARQIGENYRNQLLGKTRAQSFFGFFARSSKSTIVVCKSFTALFKSAVSF